MNRVEYSVAAAMQLSVDRALDRVQAAKLAEVAQLVAASPMAGAYAYITIKDWNGLPPFRIRIGKDSPFDASAYAGGAA